MKIFVATSEGQGLRRSDFFHSKENELVFLPLQCASAKYIDGSCGCGRSLEGLESGATTTFKVEDSNLTKEEYLEKFFKSLVKLRRFEIEEIEDDRKFYLSEVEMLLEAANVFPAELVLEKRGNDIQPRPQFSYTIEDDE